MATHSYNPSTWEVEVRKSDAKDQPGILETLISTATMAAGKVFTSAPTGFVGNESWSRGIPEWVLKFVSAHTHPSARSWVNGKDLVSAL